METNILDLSRTKNYMQTLDCFTEIHQSKLVIAFIQKHQSMLDGYISKHLRDKSRTQDVRQDTLLATLEYMQSNFFENELHCMRFVFNHARYKIAITNNPQRAMLRDTFYNSEFIDTVELKEEVDLLQSLVDKKKNQFLQSQLSCLEMYDQLFIKIYLEHECNITQVARIMKVSPRTAQRKLSDLVSNFRLASSQDAELKQEIVIPVSDNLKTHHNAQIQWTFVDAFDYSINKVLCQQGVKSIRTVKCRLGCIAAVASSIGLTNKKMHEIKLSDYVALCHKVTISHGDNAKRIIYSAFKLFELLQNKGITTENLFVVAARQVLLTKSYDRIQEYKKRVQQAIDWINEGSTYYEVKTKAAIWNVSFKTVENTISEAFSFSNNPDRKKFYISRQSKQGGRSKSVRLNQAQLVAQWYKDTDSKQALLDKIVVEFNVSRHTARVHYNECINHFGKNDSCKETKEIISKALDDAGIKNAVVTCNGLSSVTPAQLNNPKNLENDIIEIVAKWIKECIYPLPHLVKEIVSAFHVSSKTAYQYKHKALQLQETKHSNSLKKVS